MESIYQSDTAANTAKRIRKKEQKIEVEKFKKYIAHSDEKMDKKTIIEMRKTTQIHQWNVIEIIMKFQEGAYHLNQSWFFVQKTMLG